MTRRDFLRLTAAGAAGTLSIPFLSGAVASASGSVPAQSTNHVKLGVFAEPFGTESGYFPAFVDFQNAIQRGVAIYRSYRSWGQPIFNTTIDSILDPRRNPYPPPMLYLTFHAFLDSKGRNCIAWADIAAGVYDAQIDSWAAELLTLGGAQTYVAFHHEMENEEGTPPSGCGTAADFIAAYWYFRRRMEVVNAVPNLVWVIAYMHDTFAPYMRHGGPDRWWPSGSPYPDVPDDHLVGADIYNRYLCRDREWRWFTDLVEPVVETNKAPFTILQYPLNKGRRLFLGECGCVEGYECGGILGDSVKAEWYGQVLSTVRDWDHLEALVYSNASGYGDGNFRVQSSQQALDAFTTLAHDPYFN